MFNAFTHAGVSIKRGSELDHLFKLTQKPIPLTLKASELFTLGFIEYNGNIVLIKDLIDSDGYFNFEGNLDLSDSPITSLPPKLRINGDLYFENLPCFENLTSEIIVTGTLTFFSCSNLKGITGDLSGNNIIIKHNPQLTTVAGKIYAEETIDFSWSTNLKEFKAEIQCHNFKAASCYELISLPSTLKTHRLVLDSCYKLESLPGELSEFSNLFLSKCIRLTSLPDRLNVEENLFLDECLNLTSLPKNLNVGGTVFATDVPLCLDSEQRRTLRIVDYTKDSTWSYEVPGILRINSYVHSVFKMSRLDFVPSEAFTSFPKEILQTLLSNSKIIFPRGEIMVNGNLNFESNDINPVKRELLLTIINEQIPIRMAFSQETIDLELKLQNFTSLKSIPCS